MYGPFFLRRRSIRLKGYDYAQPGAYFVTLCTQGHVCLFGDIVDGEMQLNEYGRVVRQCWDEIPDHFPHAETDAFVIMPNHIHGILWIVHPPVGARPVGARHAAPLQEACPRVEQFGKPVPGSIPTIVRSLKSAAAQRINALRGTPGVPIWQRNYYEHIVRGERDLDAIREYILANPARWPADPENPATLERGGLP